LPVAFRHAPAEPGLEPANEHSGTEIAHIVCDMSEAVQRTSWWRRAHLGDATARAAELALAGVGLAYFLDSSPGTEIAYLGWFDLVAITYLTTGFFVVRRSRKPGPSAEHQPPTWSVAWRRRLGFLLTVVASLTGLTAATDTLLRPAGDEKASGVRVLGVVAVVCAWMILHIGYAAFYRHLDRSTDGRGFRFPHEDHPILLDYLYFAVTLGVSFAASDVEVIRRTTRWHVMVHEVVSFFYNTAILAIAVSVITGTR